MNSFQKWSTHEAMMMDHLLAVWLRFEEKNLWTEISTNIVTPNGGTSRLHIDANLIQSPEKSTPATLGTTYKTEYENRALEKPLKLQWICYTVLSVCIIRTKRHIPELEGAYSIQRHFSVNFIIATNYTNSSSRSKTPEKMNYHLPSSKRYFFPALTKFPHIHPSQQKSISVREPHYCPVDCIIHHMIW
jgi:hypothetical protein